MAVHNTLLTLAGYGSTTVAECNRAECLGGI